MTDPYLYEDDHVVIRRADGGGVWVQADGISRASRYDGLGGISDAMRERANELLAAAEWLDHFEEA